MVAFIARSATKTLDFLIHLLRLDRRHNHTSTVSTSAAVADNNSGDPFLSRFLNFFKPNPNPNPSTSNLQQKPRGLVQCDDLLISFKRSTHPDETLHLFQELKRIDLFKPNLRIYTTVMDALVSLISFEKRRLSSKRRSVQLPSDSFFTSEGYFTKPLIIHEKKC